MTPVSTDFAVVSSSTFFPPFAIACFDSFRWRTRSTATNVLANDAEFDQLLIARADSAAADLADHGGVSLRDLLTDLGL